MSFRRKVLVIFFLVLLVLVNLKLFFDLWHARRATRRLEERLQTLLEQEKRLQEEFLLKQEYMRKMLTDQDFVEQIIRQKEGYIKENEIIIKFED